MRIALVTGEFPPMEGGVGAFTQELARAMSDLGHEIHVITRREAIPAAERQRRGRNTGPVDLGFARLHPRIGRWRWPSVSTLADLTLRYEFDVVNIQYQASAFNMKSPAINLLPWRLKHLTRTVVTFHDLRIPYLFPRAGPAREIAINFMARQARGVITTNDADFESPRARLHTRGPAPLPLASIPIGSSIDVYRANHVEISEARDLLGLRRGDVLLGYFGFLNESKGADTLIRALAVLPANYHLVFVGGQSGSSDETNNAFLSQVKELVAGLKLTVRVHWTGFMSDTRVSTYLQAADLMVMPYRDGVSLRRGTLMAVLAHGRPLITTMPVTPVPELVHGENVWLVPANDAPGLSEAVVGVMQDPALRERLGENAARLAGQFSWPEIARRTITFYESIADPRRKGAY